jgi:hypothetical protein
MVLFLFLLPGTCLLMADQTLRPVSPQWSVPGMRRWQVGS